MKAVDPVEAIGFLAFIAGWSGGRFPLYLDGSREAAQTIAADDPAKLARRAHTLDFDESRQVEVGLPEARKGAGVSKATVLWAWVENREQVQRAGRRFRPLPSLVLRMGASCRRLCVWAVNEEIPWPLVESGNKKIAYALHAPQKYAEPERLRIPLPGTFLRVGRVRPAPVLVTRMELDSFTRSELVGRLKDPPRPWVQRQRESGAWR